MKSIIEAIRRVLRRDSLVFALIGEDEHGEVKAYQGVAKLDSTAPYIVLNVLPGSDITGAYGEEYAVELISIQVTAWGETSKQAWQLADAIQDALTVGDYEVEPYTLMKVRRNSFPPELTDRDTQLVQVPVQYLFWLSKEGVTL